jgi:hypothetical protein
VTRLDRREVAVVERRDGVEVASFPSAEARYPVAIEQGYAAARWIGREGASMDLDAGRMAVAGELGAAERLTGPRRPSTASPTTNPCPSPDSAATQSTDARMTDQSPAD